MGPQCLQESRVVRKWAFGHMQTAKLQASLRIRAVSPEALLFALKLSSKSTACEKQTAQLLARLSSKALYIVIYLVRIYNRIVPLKTLWTQIRRCEHRSDVADTDQTLRTQIRRGGHRSDVVDTDQTTLTQIRQRGHRSDNVDTDQTL